ncbi:MAG TPA: hypothetical protein VFM93_07445 [Candidatus Limnocylindria bacterium]|nr:hypothetical protein [Candidatus Limnocylindria bacterium]
MTVAIAALAERPRAGGGARAIVLVADKQETWEDSGLREESEIEKRRELPGGWQMLYAGDPDAADETADALQAVRPAQVRKAATLRRLAKAAYQRVRQTSFEERVLTPRQLTLRDVSGRRLDDLPAAVLFDYVHAKVEWERDYGAELIFAGFDENGHGTLFSIDDPGVMSRSSTHTFKTIGSGAAVARMRLISLALRPSDRAHEVLYKALDAKFHAELTATVGAGTDAWIMARTRTGGHAPHKVKLPLIHMVRRAVTAGTGSAFAMHDPPRRDWKERLERYVTDVLAGRRPDVSDLARR